MSADDLAGRAFAHYRGLERIGAGGMGVVYRAHDETLGREVVLKLLPEEAIGDSAARARLLDEARKAAGLNHPNICTIHEVGEAEGQIYVAMERVDGRPLGERIGSGGLPVETAIALAIQIADAVAHAHDRGIVHRDLKSANVVITPEGRAKVLDFGIARRVDPASQATAPGATATPAGAIAGTTHYLPPEAFRGERVDARGDVWALGVLFHEMLTGGLPFRGNTEFELGAAILNAEPAPLPIGVPAGLRSVVQRCLVKDPAGRFQRASEVRAVLEMVRGETAGAPSHAPPAVATPRGARRPRLLLATAILAVLVVGVIAIGMALRGRRAPGTGAIRSLAVLPLANLSRDPEQEYFADGMTEELITSLANLQGVRVISRTSVMRYKGTPKSLRQISRELGVDAVIEGSALRVGDRVRITAQLIHGANDQHLWAKSYERDLRDVLALQGEVARAIAGEIRTTLTPGTAAAAGRARPVDPRAYEAYLRGRFHWNRRNPVSLREAIGFFQRAIEIDPDYALAHAGLADVYVVISSYTGRPVSEAHPLARAAAERALRLDPGLAGPHAALALVKANEYDWAGAEAEFQQALRLNPNDAGARHWRGITLYNQGRFDEALAEIDRGLAIDPLALIIRNTRGRILQAQRRFDEALAEYQTVLELEPAFSIAHVWIFRNHLARGRFATAVAHLRTADSLDRSDLHGYDALARAARSRDPRVFWRENLAFSQDSVHRPVIFPSVLAECHAQLGETDAALALLERAFAERDPTVTDLIREWSMDPLRSDSRFVALLGKYGLEP